MTSEKLKVAIIGCGRMAGFHARVLNALDTAELVAVSSRTDEKREAFMQEYGIAKGYADYKDLLSQEQLDAVFVAVSINSMFEVTKACLEKGVSSFIEKPPALEVSEVAELAELAKKNNVKNMVGFQRRFYSHILQAQRIMEDHGGLVAFHVEAPELFEAFKARPEKFPENVLKKWIYANSIHCIDMLPFLGGKIKTIFATSKNVAEDLHPDSLNAMVEFENGVTGHYTSNWMSPGSWSINMYAKGVRVIIDPMEKGKVVFKDKTEKHLDIQDCDKDFKAGVYLQNQEFINLCLGKSEYKNVASTLEETLYTMKICEKIYDPKVEFSA